MKIEDKNRKHSLLPPSGAYRWMNCSGSVLLPEDEIEKDTTAADEGSLAHKIAELKMTASIWNNQNEQELSECRKNELYKPEMDDYVTSYINFIESQNINERYVEQKVSLEKYISGLYGICDCILMNASKRELHIIDLKYGFGKVSAKDNPQLRIYAMGAAEIFMQKYPEFIDQDFTIKTTIFQPRAKNTNSETIRYKDLKRWFNQFIKPAAKKILNQQVERNSGEWCRYCTRQIRCDKYNESLTKIAVIDFFSLSDSDVVKNYEKLKEVEALMKKLRGFIVKKLENGQAIEGYRLSYPNIRSWKESDELFKLAKKHNLYNLLSVPQAEKKIGKDVFGEIFGDFVETTKGNPKLEKRRKSES